MCAPWGLKHGHVVVFQFVCNNFDISRVQPGGLPALPTHKPEADQWHRAIAVPQVHTIILRTRILCAFHHIGAAG